MKAGFFSPLPPARTGVADYSAALLRELKRHGEVEVDAETCDAALYHVGNNQLHADIYHRALEQPGVVVLHDAVLHHFHLGALSEPEYVEEFVYNYGAWNVDMARKLYLGRARSASDELYFRYPMLKRVAEVSHAVIVHNPAAAEMVLAHAPNARVVEIPHPFVGPEGNFESGLRSGEPVFAVFGHLRESKRILAVLRAFRNVPGARLLVAGECVSRDLELAMEPLAGGSRITRVGYLPEPEFRRQASAITACINLRYPAAGETSGVAIRLMGIGKTVIVSRGKETVRIPESACLRVDNGLAEEDQLAAFMSLLRDSPQYAQEIGASAAAHIREHHEIERVGEQYWRVLREAAA